MGDLARWVHTFLKLARGTNFVSNLFMHLSNEGFWTKCLRDEGQTDVVVLHREAIPGVVCGVSHDLPSRSGGASRALSREVEIEKWEIEKPDSTESRFLDGQIRKWDATPEARMVASGSKNVCPSGLGVM